MATIPSFERASQARTHPPPFLSASSCADRIPRISTPLEFVHKATSGVKLDWSAAGRVLVNQERVVSRALTEPLLRQPALRPVCPRAGDCVVVPNQVRCRISEQTYGPANRLVVDVYHLRVRSVCSRVTRRPRAWILQLCELIKQGSRFHLSAEAAVDSVFDSSSVSKPRSHRCRTKVQLQPPTQSWSYRRFRRSTLEARSTHRGTVHTTRHDRLRRVRSCLVFLRYSRRQARRRRLRLGVDPSVTRPRTTAA